MECGVTEDQVIDIGDGSFTVSDEGRKRLHSPKCQRLYDCKQPVPDVVGLAERCRSSVPFKMQLMFDDVLHFHRLVSALHEPTCSFDEDVDVGEDEGMCPDRSMVSHNCGHLGVKQEECEQEGCCWDPNHDDRTPNRNWCYHSREQKKCEKRCPSEYFDKQQRAECTPFLLLERFTHPDPAVRGNACNQMGCCWQELDHGSREPWCFHTPCLL